jgi:hypothetical protein
MDPIDPLPGNRPQTQPSSTPPRPARYRPQRARWPGVVGAAVIFAAVVALVAWSRHDSSSRTGSSSATGALEQLPQTEAPGDAVNRDLAMTDSTTAAIAVAPAKQ